ncbi:MAG TPA: prepilin-type N-terminal cleavage/methylation domain-containing protein [Rhodanobacteraceae bacterium]|nr:prepilin-type N-terminal cleavage/methylation domain-containing protein [Rhodanobacteraceae bacterium]
MTPSIDRIALARGFSLIELLVVVVIVAVLALAVTLSVAGSSDRQLSRESDRFDSLVHLACEKAEQSGREIGVDVGTGGFSFKQLAGAEWQDADGDSALRQRAWLDGLRVTLTREGHGVDLGARNAPPEIVCFSSGEMTPFVLTLALGDARPYRITGSDDGTTKRDRVEARR